MGVSHPQLGVDLNALENFQKFKLWQLGMVDPSATGLRVAQRARAKSCGGSWENRPQLDCAYPRGRTGVCADPVAEIVRSFPNWIVRAHA
jgi:hypothetical protein